MAVLYSPMADALQSIDADVDSALAISADKAQEWRNVRMILIALRIAEQSPWGGLYVYVATRQGRSPPPRSRGRAHSTAAGAAWPQNATRHQRAGVPAQAQMRCATMPEQELVSASLAQDDLETLSPQDHGFLDGKIVLRLRVCQLAARSRAGLGRRVPPRDTAA